MDMNEVQMKELKDLINLTAKCKVLGQADLYQILPFERTKVQQLIRANKLPVVKIGRDYVTTFSIIEEWIKDNLGKEIFYC